MVNYPWYPARMIGQKFGRLFVIGNAGRRGKHLLVNCRCDCGAVTTVQKDNLTSGHTTSCGCLRRERAIAATIKRSLTHGHTRGGEQTRAHSAWSSMRQRCYNPKHRAYSNYGGRGIAVCDWWSSFINFYTDMGNPPIGMSLDRIDNQGDYELSNCRWATQRTQCRNTRRTVFTELQVREIKRKLSSGESRHTVAKLYGVKVEAVRSIQRGLTWRDV